MPDNILLELTGSVEHIIYHNEKNQYTVLEMLGADELITVVGTFPYVSEGEELKVYGKWSSHPSFGVQFKAEAFEMKKDAVLYKETLKKEADAYRTQQIALADAYKAEQVKLADFYKSEQIKSANEEAEKIVTVGDAVEQIKNAING